MELGDPTIALGNSEYCPVTHGIVRKIDQSCSSPRKSRRTFVPPVFMTLQKGRVLSETTGRALKVRTTPSKRRNADLPGTPQIPPGARVVAISKLHLRSRRRRGIVLQSFAGCIAHDRNYVLSWDHRTTVLMMGLGASA